jgi:hypothetical protein
MATPSATSVGTHLKGGIEKGNCGNGFAICRLNNVLTFIKIVSFSV